LFPKLDGILCGTTMMRVMELAKRLTAKGLIRKAAFADISRADMKNAAEIIVVGTSPNVAAVREFDGRRVADGRPGPVALNLNALLVDDILHNRRLQTRTRLPANTNIERGGICSRR
jgi:branched-subunit amino acid aminotransferase/4-amino-4-deoxychorismate lyase